MYRLTMIFIDLDDGFAVAGKLGIERTLEGVGSGHGCFFFCAPRWDGCLSLARVRLSTAEECRQHRIRQLLGV